tara:strand:+ start:34 stop:237 length:204 start_codon:yes stop_codon:yes gene_type:complete
MTDKINEYLLGVVAVAGGFFTKQVLGRQSKVEDRVAALEQVVVTKQDLEPLQKTTNIILEHLINQKK